MERHDRKGDRQAQEHEDQLDAKENGHRVLVAKARIEQLEPDLAELCLVGGTQRLTQLVRGPGHLGLELLLPASHPLFGLFAADRRVHDPAKAVLGASLAVAQRRQDCPDRQRDRQKNQEGKQGFEGCWHGNSHLDRHDLVDRPGAQQLHDPGRHQHLGADRCREQRTDIAIV